MGRISRAAAAASLATVGRIAASRTGVWRIAASLIAASLIAGSLTGGWLVLGGLASEGVAIASAAGTVASVAPAGVTPGATVTFTVTCASATAASATLSGQSLGLPAQIQMDADARAGQFSIRVALPGSIRPGTYHPRLTCADGTSARAVLRVSELAAAVGPAAGSGASSNATNAALTVGGLALIGVGAVAGGIAIRRRQARQQF